MLTLLVLYSAIRARTPYDRLVDDEQQMQFIVAYNQRHRQTAPPADGNSPRR